MKKKISVFALLLSLMLALLVPVSASAATETTADDVKYNNVEEFMHGMGYSSFVMDSEKAYFVILNESSKYEGLYLFGIPYEDACVPYWVINANGNKYVFLDSNGILSYDYYKFLLPDSASNVDNYEPIESTLNTTSKIESLYYKDISVKGVSLSGNYYMLGSVVYSDFPIYSVNTETSSRYYEDTSNVYYEGNRFGSYNFPLWCQDAGLNCLASTNESPTKIPYSYNSYWHIVRKTSNGKWLLTTIGNSVLHENIDSYKLYIGDNGNFHVASIYGGDNVNGYMLNVRQYEYDTDGWKVRTYETFDTRDYSGVVDLGAGSGFDDTRKLAYTNIDIFVGIEFEPTYPKSTEYFEVTTTPDTPDEPDSPTSTPSNPSGGSGSEGGGTGGGTRPESPDIGGDVEPGGGLDFIISLFTKIWTDICSVNMSVDGYSINLQQIVIYGALVSIVGGFIMHFIFGRK